MGEARRWLPRGPHAEKPGPDETILQQSGADLQNGWLARHGELSPPRTGWSSCPPSSTRSCAPSAARSSSTTSREIERFPVSPRRNAPAAAAARG